MVSTEKIIRRTRNVLIAFAIICLTPICEKGRLLNGAKGNSHIFADQEIVCVIDLGDDMRGSHGLETGFSYELAERFAQDNGCSVRIITADNKREVNYIDSLRYGKADILITHIENKPEDIQIARMAGECTCWATAGENTSHIMEINKWLSYFSTTEEYNILRKKFFSSTNPVKRAAKGIIAENVSPYDLLFKEYAAELGWDWRMLAAVVYQESKFSINSTSHRGAVGLMQVMPQTGAKYGFDDLVNPQNNLTAGIAHLRRLQKQFQNKGFSQDEIIKFTLAAYNAGEGRVMDCRNLAASKGLDNTKWENIVQIIPLMREDDILEDENVKLGKFQGFETIAYVESIMEIYEAVCSICPKA